MKTLHYFSGITIALFVGICIVNHLTILHSEALHISFMQVARKVYRHPLVEFLLLAAVLVQIVTGIALVFNKWGKLASVFDWIHVLSGLYMALFLTVHVSAVLVGRYKLHVDTNLWYGAGVMNLSPQKFFFIPYYLFALLAFFFHVACIHKTKMAAYTEPAIAHQQALFIMIAGIIISSVIIIKMSNLRLPDEFVKAMQKH